jgi:two-component system nitrate/nitrite response regulator NarP
MSALPALKRLRETVLFVDDHPTWSHLLEARVMVILTALGRLGRSEHSTDLKTALQLAQTVTPEIVFLDLNLSDSRGMQTLTAMRAALPDARISVVSGETATARVHRMLRAGADAFIPKDLAPGALDEALREVLAHGYYAPVSLLVPPVAISDAESRVLQAVANGLRDREIAVELSISVNTVEAHMKKLFRSFDVATRVMLVTKSRLLGYVD